MFLQFSNRRKRRWTERTVTVEFCGWSDNGCQKLRREILIFVITVIPTQVLHVLGLCFVFCAVDLTVPDSRVLGLVIEPLLARRVYAVWILAVFVRTVVRLQIVDQVHSV